MIKVLVNVRRVATRAIIQVKRSVMTVQISAQGVLIIAIVIAASQVTMVPCVKRRVLMDVGTSCVTLLRGIVRMDVLQDIIST